MLKQIMQKLAGIMMLLYALATLLLPYVHDRFEPIGSDPGEKIIPDFAFLVQLIALACSDLFLIPLVFAVMMLIGGILALKKPCVPVLIADGILCICAYCYAGYLYRNSGAIFSELSGVIGNVFPLNRAVFSIGFWAAALCTVIALIGCICGLIGRKKQETDQPTEGESSC